jgi:hypothetical protein
VLLKSTVKKSVDLMLNEYENNSGLIALTTLDNEGFLLNKATSP